MRFLVLQIRNHSGNGGDEELYEYRTYPPQFYYIRRSEAFNSWKFKLKIILNTSSYVNCRLVEEYKVSISRE